MVWPSSTISYRSDNHQREQFSSSAKISCSQRRRLEEASHTYRKASPPVSSHALLVALHLPVLHGSPDASSGSFMRHVASFRSTRLLGSDRGSEFAAARPPAAKARMMLNLILPVAVRADVGWKRCWKCDCDDSPTEPQQDTYSGLP